MLLDFLKDSPMLRAYGGLLPSSYVSFDTETTGFSTEKDLILEFGYAVVEDGEVKADGALLLNWFDFPGLDADRLEMMVERISDRMRHIGAVWNITSDLLRKDGVNPVEAFQFFADLCAGANSSGKYILGHNVLRYDIPIVLSCMRRFAPGIAAPEFPRVIDTHCLENAVQMNEAGDDRVRPVQGHDLTQYCDRFKGFAKKTKLSGLVDKYGLAETYQLEKYAAHAAQADALATSALLCHYNAQMLAHPVAPVRGVVEQLGQLLQGEKPGLRQRNH